MIPLEEELTVSLSEIHTLTFTSLASPAAEMGSHLQQLHMAARTDHTQDKETQRVTGTPAANTSGLSPHFKQLLFLKCECQGLH